MEHKKPARDHPWRKPEGKSLSLPEQKKRLRKSRAKTKPQNINKYVEDVIKSMPNCEDWY